MEAITLYAKLQAKAQLSKLLTSKTTLHTILGMMTGLLGMTVQFSMLLIGITVLVAKVLQLSTGTGSHQREAILKQALSIQQTLILMFQEVSSKGLRNTT